MPWDECARSQTQTKPVIVKHLHLNGANRPAANNGSGRRRICACLRTHNDARAILCAARGETAYQSKEIASRILCHHTTDNLLESSKTPGYAMEGTDRNKMLGAVVVKAMGSLESGNGMIEVLVMLQ